MESTLFDQLEATLRTEGPEAAISSLCTQLRQTRQYNALFYALLLKKRQELGLNPIPTGPSTDLPEGTHARYEEGIREAARTVGHLYLQDGEISQAWVFFRMLEEPEPVRAALETLTPDPEADLQPLVQVAFYEGVHPRKGFDWILQRYGLCSAITTLGSGELPFPEDVKRYCFQSLVRALHQELRLRLTAEIEVHEGKAPAEAEAPEGTVGVLPALLAHRDWLFADEAYHIDLSHLSSVVQMSLQLEPSPELELARELCQYGQKLSGRFINPGDPPFEDLYRAHAAYLGALAGDQVETNLDYFRAQADKADPYEVGTYPAEVLVNLLLRLNRPEEALAVARKHLSNPNGQRLTCPGINELCHKVGDFQTLAEVAREQGDAVHYLAGLLATRK